MAEVQSVSLPPASYPRPIPERTGHQMPPPTSVSLPESASVTKIRNGHLNLDTFSPVNQNGSFEFDRVLKSGFVQKRTRKTKTWKPIYLVLRPNLLSMYRDQNEDKLRHKIDLSDLTTVAFLKDPKQKRQNVFGLFSPSRNYHLEAASKKDAEEWVDLIRQEARIEEEEEEMFLASPGGGPGANNGPDQGILDEGMESHLPDERLGSSSPEPTESLARSIQTNMGITGSQRRPSHTLEYSGNELASHSDMSDAEVQKAMGTSAVSGLDESAAGKAQRPMLAARNASQMSGFNMEQDPERVVWQGHLLYLKSTGGVKQWKDLWAVLRQKNLALYKDEAEYSPHLIIPLTSIINAVEIDAVSKTKTHCMQVITEEKSYRFCAFSEEDLDNSLGAFKSLLAKRKENDAKRATGPR